MSHKTELLPRLDGESLTDWTLRFLADGRQQLRVVQEVQRSVTETTWDEERRRLRDLYDACTPREAEYAEPEDD